MKAELIKTEKGYYLDTGKLDGVHLACYPHSIDKQKLSLKNCQAIERGYDFEEEMCKLVDKKAEQNNQIDLNAYGQGCLDAFQKALEILGDKKFSEDDMKRIYEKGYSSGRSELNSRESDKIKYGYIQSLQQNEWEVGIEMESNLHIGEVVDDSYPIDFPTQKPKLDADGCLILKRA
jgi:hypothetical protein